MYACMDGWMNGCVCVRARASVCMYVCMYRSYSEIC